MAAPRYGTAPVGDAIGTAPVPVPTGGGETPVEVAAAETGGGVPAMRPTLEFVVVNATWGKVTREVTVQFCGAPGPAGACTCPSAIWVTGAPEAEQGKMFVTVTVVNGGDGAGGSVPDGAAGAPVSGADDPAGGGAEVGPLVGAPAVGAGDPPDGGGEPALGGEPSTGELTGVDAGTGAKVIVCGTLV